MIAEISALLFVWLLGLSIGSFLNVVIYRLPRGLSVGSPRWSFCPNCQATLHWHDNVPVLSWMLLRARCRSCRASISCQYPLVEALTGLVFVLTFHLLFVAAARHGLMDPTPMRDWPYGLAWLTLAAALIAVSVMDIVTYSLDVRVTEFVVVAGCVFHMIWGRASFHSEVAASSWSAAASAAFLVMLFMLWRSVWRSPRNDGDESPHAEPALEDETAAVAQPRDVPPIAITMAGVACLLVLGGLITLAPWLLGPADAGEAGVFARLCSTNGVVGAAFLAIFTVMVLAGSLQRESDAEVHAAIEAEAVDSRGLALRELLWLSPMMLAGLAAALLIRSWPAGFTAWHAFMNLEVIAGHQPFAGLAFAIHGAVVGATAGWLLRILFTLVFGREAFGVGDIYILAAAGAAAGWDTALMGLLLAVGVAMAGWLISQVLKSTSMIPFGPPLALGFLAALWLDLPASRVMGFYRDSLKIAYREQPALLAVLGGVMLVGSGAAILGARLVRSWVERPSSEDPKSPAEK